MNVTGTSVLMASPLLPRVRSAADRRQEPNDSGQTQDLRAASASPSMSTKLNTALSTAEQRQVAKLQQIDRMVRAHEQAHISAGGDVITTGASFSYATGPDGKRYAVGGEVGIDTAPEKTAQANIDKGARIQAAALAPANPSPQDYQVAAIGSQIEMQGRSDLARERREEGSAAASTQQNRVIQAYAVQSPLRSLISVYA